MRRALPSTVPSTSFASAMALLAIGACLPTVAQAAAAAPAEAAISSSSPDIKLGDKGLLPADATIFRTRKDDGTDSTESGEPRCAPADASFTVDSITPIDETDPKKRTVTVHFGKRYRIWEIGSCVQPSPPAQATTNPQTLSTTPAGKGTPSVLTVQRDISYNVAESELTARGIHRQGFTWGGLAIPYKYEFSDHSFVANPSMVAYLGYEGWSPGKTVAGVLVAGLGAATESNQKTSTGSGGSSSTGSRQLWTFGGGVIATFGGSFKVGALVGVDLAGSGSGFRHDSKPWIALSIGF